jgi:hypothetical protein
MSVVIPFPSRPRPSAQLAGPILDDSERAVVDALANGADRAELVRAAYPLLEHCRDRFGVAVFLDGLPNEKATLADALVKLSQALRAAASIMARSEPTWAIGVSFNGTTLASVDADGATELGIPVDTDVKTMSRFLVDQIKAQVA